MTKLLKTFCVSAGLLCLPLSGKAVELPDFTALVENISPAVVNISTKVKDGDKILQRRIPNLPEDSPFNDFFKKFFEEIPQGDGDSEDEDEPFGGHKSTSLGSGFIISADGYVVTNHHVIDGAEQIFVRLNDRSEYQAKLIGSDERSDVAVLKVDAQNLPMVKIGSSEQLKVGEWVLAIGSPFGFDYSVTAGIVSAKGRSLPGSDSNYVPFIQTDVAINPGNSGGPLFNLQGEVVGVNAQIYSRTGGFMGLSFTIPVDTVMNVVEQLRAHGKVSRGWLGVLIQDVDRQLAESFSMDKPQGALIAKILDTGPAKNAGFQVGDIILAFDGKTISHSAELPPIVGESPVGKEVEAIVLRKGEKITVKVLLEELPAQAELDNASGSSRSATSNTKLGLSVEGLPESLPEGKDKLPDHGVRVAKVASKGAAREAGIQSGDIILSLDNQDVKDVAHFEELSKTLEAGRAVPVLVQRGDSPVFLALRVPEEDK